MKLYDFLTEVYGLLIENKITACRIFDDNEDKNITNFRHTINKIGFKFEKTFLVIEYDDYDCFIIQIGVSEFYIKSINNISTIKSNQVISSIFNLARKNINKELENNFENVMSDILKG